MGRCILRRSLIRVYASLKFGSLSKCKSLSTRLVDLSYHDGTGEQDVPVPGLEVAFCIHALDHTESSWDLYSLH